jgi:phage tail tape-measure protein
MSDQQSSSDHYAAVLADLHRRRSEIDDAIRVIEAVCGLSQQRAANLEQAPSTEASPATPTQGQFLGMSIAEAAKKLLSIQRRTMNSAEIAQGLINGGFAMSAADPNNVIGSVLTRRFNNVGDIVRVSRGQWGLSEWYPNRSFKKKPGKPDAASQLNIVPNESGTFDESDLENGVFPIP